MRNATCITDYRYRTWPTAEWPIRDRVHDGGIQLILQPRVKGRRGWQGTMATEWRSAMRWVPQRSWLSPLFFNVRDLSQASTSPTAQFVDDITQSEADLDEKTVIEKLAESFIKIFCKKTRIVEQQAQDPIYHLQNSQEKTIGQTWDPAGWHCPSSSYLMSSYSVWHWTAILHLRSISIWTPKKVMVPSECERGLGHDWQENCSAIRTSQW